MKSMTGYGHARAQGRGFSLEIELQSYNHRFLDLRLKLPSGFIAQEALASKLIGNRLARGRINLHTELEVKPGQTDSLIDAKLASRYWESLKKLETRLDCKKGFNPEVLLSFPGILLGGGWKPPTREFKRIFQLALEEALDKLEVMREKEGKRLKTDLAKHLRALKQGLLTSQKLLKKQVEPIVNVAEEIERLLGHIKQFSQVLKADRPVGKELEFITREMLREVTTLADKSANLEISQQAIGMKVAIESLKEQVRNAE